MHTALISAASTNSNSVSSKLNCMEPAAWSTAAISGSWG